VIVFECAYDIIGKMESNNKRLLRMSSILLIIFISTVALFAGEVQVIEAKIHNDNAVNHEDTDKKDTIESNTDVLRHSVLFNKIIFTPDHFDAWSKLLIDANSFNFLKRLHDNGHISKEGLTTGLDKDSMEVSLNNDAMISFPEIQKFYAEKYPNYWIYDQLLAVGVIDKSGYINLMVTNNEQYVSVDFTSLDPLIHKIQINIEDSDLKNNLYSELLSCLKDFSKVTVEEKKETNQYHHETQDHHEIEHSKDVKDLVSNVCSFFVSNAATAIVGAALFNNEKTYTATTNGSYSPRIQVQNYYDKIAVGFTPFPLYKKSAGPIMLFGKRFQRRLSSMFASGNNVNYQHISLDIYGVTGYDYSNSQFKLSGTGVSIRNQMFLDKTDKLTWTQVLMDFLSVADNFEFHGLIGGDYITGVNYPNEIGLGLGIRLIGYINHNAGTYIEWFGSYNAPSYSYDDKTQFRWGINEYGLGANYFIDRLNFSLGYQWVYSMAGDNLFNALTLSSGLAF
jgi:ABC-type nickel/cobalt efflux system permease component RcnA